jgi:hypothetical protein
VQDLVAQAQEEGELARGISPEDAAAAIVATTAGFEVLSTWDRDWLSRERAGRIWAFLLPLLSGSPDPTRAGPDGEERPAG